MIDDLSIIFFAQLSSQVLIISKIIIENNFNKRSDLYHE